MGHFLIIKIVKIISALKKKRKGEKEKLCPKCGKQ